MRFVFLTAIRIAPLHWITWRQHLSALFSKDSSPAGYSCYDGLRTEVIITAEEPLRPPKQNMGKLLASLKAQDLFHKELPSLGDNPDDSANLILLKTGELCRVDQVEMSAEEVLSQHEKIQTQIRSSLPLIAQKMMHFMPDGLSADELVIDGQNAIHTLMPYDEQDKTQIGIIETFFAREGLVFGEQRNNLGPFAPGWSFSALASTDPREVCLFAAVAMRLQCVWYQQRGQRNFCIEQTALLAKQETVEAEITTSHEVTRRLFDFTLWEHELREFSANLKPWLKVAFDSLYQFWDMSEESVYIEKTLKHSHELLASGYQSRMLIQERQQSRLLFVIAAVGLLGIVGSLMSIWTALTLGNLVTDDFWKSDIGSMIIAGVVVANLLALVFVMYRFITTQLK